MFAVIMGARRIEERIPGALIALIASILAVAVFHLKSHSVTVPGSIHGGLPAFGLLPGSLTDARAMFAPALTVAFLCVAQTAVPLS